MNIPTYRLVAVLGLLLGQCSSTIADPLKANPVVGVFTVRPLAPALLAPGFGLVESGAGFLFADGTAVGFNQIIVTPQTQIPASDVNAFLAGEGVLPLASQLTVDFSSWELRPNGTVTISGTLTGGGIFGLSDPYVGPVMGGFIFSPVPISRDLIGGDGVADHVEYIDSDPDKNLITDVGEFLVGQGLLSKGEAKVIEVSLRGDKKDKK